MADRVSQEAVEVLIAGSTSKARVSQEAVEVLLAGSTSKARVSQIAVEVLITVTKHQPRNPTINHQNPAVL